MLEVEIPEMCDSEYKDIQSGNAGVVGMLEVIESEVDCPRQNQFHSHN